MDDKTTGVGGERGGSDERMTGRGDEIVGGRASTGRTPKPATRVEDRTTGSTAGSRSTVTPPRDRGPEERTDEIRAEIEQTREDMSETVNAIQERLRPRNIASNAAERVRHVARDRARDIAESETVQGIRANPIPTAMIGIGIAGAAWMAFNRREGQRYRRRPYYGGARTDWRMAAGYREEDNYYRGVSGGGREYDTAAGYTPGLSYDAEREYDVGYATKDYARGQETGGLTSRAGEVADDLRRRARQSTYRAQSELQRTWNENPLLVGAASAVLGALIGLAVPETERENQLMGETRDNMIEGVQQMAKDTAKKVQDAAANAATSAVGLVSDDKPSDTNQ